MWGLLDQAWQKVYRPGGHPRPSSDPKASFSGHWYTPRPPPPAIDVAFGPAAAHCAPCARLPARAQAVRSVPGPGDDQLPIVSRPDRGFQFRRSGGKGDATFSLDAAGDIAIAPARFAAGLRDSAPAAQKYRE